MTDSGSTPEASTLEEPVRSALAGAGLNAPDATVARLAHHLAMTLKWNRSMSLTAITDPARAIRLHIVESFQAAAHVRPESGGLLDIGSGNGYPALPIKMAHPALATTLLEPAVRKSVFLETVARTAGLGGVQVLRERVEKASDLGRYPGTGTITMRAVKVIGEVLEGAPRVLPPGGRVILFLSTARCVEICASAPPGLAVLHSEASVDRPEGSLLVLERI